MTTDFEFEVALNTNQVLRQITEIGRLLDSVMGNVRPISLTANTAQATAQLDALGNKTIKPKIEPDLSSFGSRFDKALGDAQKRVLLLKSELAGAIVEGADSKQLEQMKLSLVEAEKEARKLQQALNSVDKEVDQVNNSKVSVTPPSGGGIGGAVLGGIIGGGVAGVVSSAISTLTEGIGQVISLGSEFEQSLAGVSAITGVTGAGLNDLGQKALDLSAKFGGGANAQLQSFQGILSRFGAQLAQTPDQLAAVSENINILAKAGGLDAAGAMDTLTNSMLQFGVNVNNADEVASESSRFINVLAASAKVGAAEIPQVGEAVLVAGVAAKQAKVSFEETNASIQVLAAGGKVGAEAGTALRNVLGKIAGEEVIPKEALAKLKSLGVDMNKVSDTSIPLSARLRELSKASKDATAFAQVFGTENAAAAAILAEGAGTIQEWTAAITGTDEANKQAATNMATFGETIERIKSQFANIGIQIFQAIAPAFTKIAEISAKVFSGFIQAIGYVFNAVKTLAPLLAVLAAGFVVYSVITNAAAIATGVATAAQWLFNAAAAANPIGLAIAGLVAAVAAYKALSDAFTVTAEESLELAEAQKKNIQTQIKDNEQKQQSVKNTKELVKEFKELADKSTLTAKEQQRLQSIQSQLDKQYPNLIDQTKSYADNLDGVAEIGKLATDSLKNLSAENDNLQKQLQKSAEIIAANKRNLAIQQLRDLAERGLLDGGKLLMFRQTFVKVREEFEKGLFNAKDNGQVDAAQDKILDFLNKNQDLIAGEAELYEKLYTAITTGANAAKNAIKEYSGENRKAAEEAEAERKKKEAEEAKKPKVKADVKEIKDISDKIIASERALNDLKNKLGLTSLADEKAREIKAAEDAKAIRLRAIQDQVKEAEKLTDVSAADKAKLLKNLQDRLDLETTLNTERDAVNAKYNEAAFQRERKRQDDLTKLTIDSSQRQIDALMNFEVQNLSIVGKIADERVRMARLRGAEEVRAFIEGTEDFKTGEKEISAQLKLNNISPDEALKQLEQLRKDVASKFQTGADPLSLSYSALNQKIAADELKIRTDNLDLLNRARIGTIENQAERERETAIAAATKGYNEDLRLAGDNENLKYLAFKKYKALQVDAEQKYLEDTKTLYETSIFSLLDNLTAGIKKAFTPDKAAHDEAKKGIEELAKAEKDLYKQRAKNEISFEDFNAKIGELAKQEAELKDKLAGMGGNLGKAFKDAFGGALSGLSDSMAAAANKSQATWFDLNKSISSNDKELNRARTELLTKYGISENATAQEVDAVRANLTGEELNRFNVLNKSAKDFSDNQTRFAEESTSAASAAYTAMGISIGATWAQLAIEGKHNIGGFVIAALSALESMIPIFLAYFFGIANASIENIASLGTWGAVKFAALTVGLTALVEVAKSEISAAGGFRHGGYTGNFREDEAAGIVHGKEFVHTAKVTRENRDLFEFLHKGGSLPAYIKVFEKDMPAQKPITLNFFTAKEAGGDIFRLFEKQFNSNLSSWFVDSIGVLNTVTRGQSPPHTDSIYQIERELQASIVQFETVQQRINVRVAQITRDMPFAGRKQDNSDILRELRAIRAELAEVKAAQYETAKEYRAHTSIEMHVKTDSDIIEAKMKTAELRNIMRG